MLLSSSSLKLDSVLQTARVLPRSGGQLVSGCHLSESCNHVRKIQIYSNIDKIIILFTENQVGGRGRDGGSWLVLTRAGGRQQGHPALHLQRMAGGVVREGKVCPGFVLHRTTVFPQGPRSPSPRRLENEHHLCLILMQPIN